MNYNEAITYLKKVGIAGYKSIDDINAVLGQIGNGSNNPDAGADQITFTEDKETKIAVGIITAALEGFNSSSEPTDEAKETVISCATFIYGYFGDPPKAAPKSTAVVERSVTNDGGTVVVTTNTKGNGADGVQAVERRGPSGMSAETPEGKTEVVTTTEHKTGTATAEHTSQSRATSSAGYDERQAAETYTVTGSSNQTINNPQAAANAAKRELVAARSGFNDNRDDTIFSILDEILSVPNDVLKAIVVMEKKDTQTQANGDGKPKNKNIWTDAWSIIESEVKSVTDYYANIFSKSAIKRAEVVIKNKKEKIKKMQERVEKMKDGTLKNKYLQAIAKGDLKTLFSFPIAEKKELTSTEDKDKVTEMATKAQEKALGAEKEVGV